MNLARFLIYLFFWRVLIAPSRFHRKETKRPTHARSIIAGKQKVKYQNRTELRHVIEATAIVKKGKGRADRELKTAETDSGPGGITSHSLQEETFLFLQACIRSELQPIGRWPYSGACHAAFPKSQQRVPATNNTALGRKIHESNKRHSGEICQGVRELLDFTVIHQLYAPPNNMGFTSKKNKSLMSVEHPAPSSLLLQVGLEESFSPISDRGLNPARTGANKKILKTIILVAYTIPLFQNSEKRKKKKKKKEPPNK